PCDQDSRGRAQDSAGYLELAGAIPVAVIADGESILQTARAAIRPDGPEVDGLIGAGVLVDARVELDYRTQPARAIFSCEASAAAPPVTENTPRTPPRARVAIRELQIEGEEVSPALGLQLQDGFVVGFVRAGIQVLDSVDVARKIEGHPELQKCDTPICLK